MAGQASETSPASAGVTGARLRLAVGGLLLGMLLAALDQTIVATALWTIVRDLDPRHGLTRLAWVVAVYLLAATTTTPLYGRLSDIVGRRPLYAVGVTLFLLGSALAALAHNLGQLIGARAVQGVGAGGLIGLTFAAIADLVPGRGRGRYQGYFGAVFAVGSIVGPLIGGLIAQQPAWPQGFTAWRWIFLINLPLGVLGLAMTLSGMPRRRGARGRVRLDVLGALLLVSGGSVALLVTQWGGQRYPWTATRLLALAGMAFGLLTVFVMWERRLSRTGSATRTVPLVPVRLFAGPVLRLAVPVAAVVGATTFGATVYVTLFVQVTDGLSPVEAGLYLVPMMAGVLLGSTGSGWVISRVGRYEVFPALGTGLAALGLVLLGTVPAHGSPVLLGCYTAMVGLGLGLVTQVLVLAVQNSVDRSDLGAATAAVTFVRQLGGAFGTAIFGAVLAAGVPAVVVADPQRVRDAPPALAHALIADFVEAAHWVFRIAAVLMFLAFLAAVLLLGVVRRAGIVMSATASASATEPAARAAPASKPQPGADLD